MNNHRPASSATELRKAFDASFAEPRTGALPPHEHCLAIVVAGHRYVLRLSEIAGLHFDRRVTWVPGPVPELLGLAGLRGNLVPVYDLGAVLQHATMPGQRRWMALAARTGIGLAFERLDSYLSVPLDTIVPAGASAANRSGCLRDMVQTGDTARPVIHVPTVVEVIAGLASRADRRRE